MNQRLKDTENFKGSVNKEMLKKLIHECMYAVL